MAAAVSSSGNSIIILRNEGGKNYLIRQIEDRVGEIFESDEGVSSQRLEFSKNLVAGWIKKSKHSNNYVNEEEFVNTAAKIVKVITMSDLDIRQKPIFRLIIVGDKHEDLDLYRVKMGNITFGNRELKIDYQENSVEISIGYS